MFKKSPIMTVNIYFAVVTDICMHVLQICWYCLSLFTDSYCMPFQYFSLSFIFEKFPHYLCSHVLLSKNNDCKINSTNVCTVNSSFRFCSYTTHISISNPRSVNHNSCTTSAIELFRSPHSDCGTLCRRRTSRRRRQ